MNTENIIPDEPGQNLTKIKKRSPVAAAFLTLLVPGLGHFYCGEIKRGFIFYILVTGMVNVFYALIKFFPGYTITIIAVFTCIPLGLYVLIESIITALKKEQYKLQFFNKSKYYIAIIITSVYFVGPFEQLFMPHSYTTPTGSMLNTVMPGDKFLDNDLYYGIKNPLTGKYAIVYNKPKNGDVVNFIYRGMPDRTEKETVNYLKRILAVPGDSFVIKNRQIYLNGEMYKYYSSFYFDEKFKFSFKYDDPMIFPKGSKWNSDNYGPVIVPKAGETVKFDTSNISMWKYIIRDEGNELEIVNDRIFINDIEKYSYTFKKNYYFIIGDNWYNSLDSRYFGFVKEDDITSKLTMIYFSWNTEIPIENLNERIKSIRWDRIGKMIE